MDQGLIEFSKEWWDTPVWKGPVFDNIIDPLGITLMEHRWKHNLILEIWDRFNTMMDKDWKPSSISPCRHLEGIMSIYPLSNKFRFPFFTNGRSKCRC